MGVSDSIVLELKMTAIESSSDFVPYTMGQRSLRVPWLHR